MFFRRTRQQTDENCTRIVAHPRIDRLRSIDISLRRLLVSSFSIFLLLFMALIAPWPVLQPHVAFAQGNPNPPLSPPSWLKPHFPPGPKNTVPILRPDPRGVTAVIPRASAVPMPPVTLTLTPQALHFVSKDGAFSLDIPAGAVSASQQQQAGGAILLTITQVLSASGGLESSSIFFGTYEFQFHDASGTPLSNLSFASPLVISYHLQPQQATLFLRGQPVYAIWKSGDLAALLASKTPATLPPTHPK